MTTLRTTLYVNGYDETDFFMESSIRKTDSFGSSTFQKIGLAYRESDAIRDRIIDNPYEAKSYFIKKMSSVGMGLELAETLLAAKGWKRRMKLAWEFLDEQEQTAAKKLDYTIFENYWPNLAFLDNHYLLSRTATSKDLEIRETGYKPSE